MNVRYPFLAVALLTSFLTAAQTIFIPDENMRNWMNQAKPNSVDVDGNCDTAAWNAQPPSTLLLRFDQLPANGSVNLQGLQHLKVSALAVMDFSVRSITTQFPGYPMNLNQVQFNRVDLSLWTGPVMNVPAQQTYYCENCGIQQLPTFGGYIMEVRDTDLSGQTLWVPSSVTLLKLTNCAITSTPQLFNVSNLTISNNPLSSWNGLPGALLQLEANNVGLVEPPPLAGSQLEHCVINGNGHTEVPEIIPSLTYLSMGNNQITELPPLAGSNLVNLTMFNNPLPVLPTLPTTLQSLNVDDTPITTLPAVLPTSMRWLYLKNTGVTTIPTLPSNFYWLRIDGTAVASLPAFPASTRVLEAINATTLTCVPILPQQMLQVKLSGSGVSCLPNIPPSLNVTPGMLGIPAVVCDITSPCPYAQPVIAGTTFRDADGDGVLDAGEDPRPGSLVVAQPGNLMTASGNNGNYVLPAGIGNFSITGLPLLYEPVTTVPYAVNITQPTQTFANNHVGFQVIPDMVDLRTTLTASVVRPGFNTQLWVHVRNVGTEPTTAFVELSFDAALNYVGSTVAPGDVTANVVQWDVAMLQPGEEWSARVDLYGAPSLVLGTPIVQQCSATPDSPDETPADNIATIIDEVVGSYDPNDKQVVPAVLTPQQAMAGTRVDYTIRFQNTGTFLAERVLITDTLSSDLQTLTFEPIAASHDHVWYINGGVLHILFDGIMLPDSTSDEPNSHGFFRFSMVPSTQLLVGESVHNVANIYFDFNEPIITEPAVLSVETSTGIASTSGNTFLLWPNPASELLTIARTDANGPAWAEVLDGAGRIVHRVALLAAQQDIDLGGIAPGLYQMRILAPEGSATKPFVRY